MADQVVRTALYRRLAAQLREQVLRDNPDSEPSYAALLVVARGPNRETVFKGLRALREAESSEGDRHG